MDAYVDILLTSVSSYGIWFVVLFLFLENVPVAGLVAPGLTILVLSGFFHEVIVSSPEILFVIAWLTIAVADTCWFLLGKYSAGHTVWLQKIVATSPKLQTVLREQNILILIFYQFLVYFRMFLPLAFGLYGYSLKKWLILCTFASFLYTSVFLGIGFIGAYLAKELTIVDQLVSNINVALVVLGLLYASSLLYKYVRIRKSAEQNLE